MRGPATDSQLQQPDGVHMFWIVLKVIVALLLAGVVSIVLLSGMAIGSLCLNLGRRGGPQAMRVAALIGTTTSVLLWTYVGSALEVEVAGIAAGIVTGGLTLAVIVSGWIDIRPEVEHDIVLASLLPRFGLDNFDTLDTDGDGFITHPDLSRAIAAAISAGGGGFYQVILRENLERVGHALDSPSRKRLIKQEGRKWFANTEDLLCGIDRNDLATFAARMRDKHKNWL
jgi:hypothetical protein